MSFNLVLANKSYAKLEYFKLETKEEFLSMVKKYEFNKDYQIHEVVSLFTRAFLDIDGDVDVDDIAKDFIYFVEKNLGIRFPNPDYAITKRDNESYHVIFNFSIDVVTLGYLVSMFRIEQNCLAIDDVVYNMGNLFRCPRVYKPSRVPDEYEITENYHKTNYGDEDVYISLPTTQNVVYDEDLFYHIVKEIPESLKINAQEQIDSLMTKSDGIHTEWFKAFKAYATTNVCRSFAFEWMKFHNLGSGRGDFINTSNLILDPECTVNRLIEVLKRAI